MAIVKEIVVRGVPVRFDDSAYIGKSPQEIAMRQARFDACVRDILLNAARREAAKAAGE